MGSWASSFLSISVLGFEPEMLDSQVAAVENPVVMFVLIDSAEFGIRDLVRLFLWKLMDEVSICSAIFGYLI